MPEHDEAKGKDTYLTFFTKVLRYAASTLPRETRRGRIIMMRRSLGGHDGGDMGNTDKQHGAGQLGSDRRYLVAVIGFTCLYAVCVSFFYSSWLVGRPGFAPTAFDNVLNPSILAASLLFSLLVRSKLPLGRTACLAVAASAMAAGIGMGLVMPFYFEAFARYSSRRIAIAFGIMSLGGMAANMLLGFAPDAVSLAAYAVLLGASALCLGFAYRAEADGSERRDPPSHARGALSKHDFLNVFLVSGVCTFALSIVYGILDTAATGTSASPAASILISQFGGIAAAAVFLAYFGTRSKPNPSMLFNVVFGILATGILFLPFLSNDYAVSLNILAAAGWKLVMLALFYLVVTTYAHCRTKLLVGISLAYALPRFGLFVGQNVAQLLGVGSTADFVRTTAVAFFLLYLILMVIWMVNSHERKRAESQARAADELLGRFAQEQESVRKLRCDALADDHGLTNREKDILYLLAQGRDLAFICETLFLSKNTVKSYQKTIYAKLDVHSKQEIIDLVHGKPDGPRR